MVQLKAKKQEMPKGNRGYRKAEKRKIILGKNEVIGKSARKLGCHVQLV